MIFSREAHQPRIGQQSEHERYLTEKHAKKPVIVMNYPKAIKAFYMRLNDDGCTVAAMDVLAPGIGKIIGSRQREERLEVLDRSMAERGIDNEHYAWYRNLRRTATVSPMSATPSPSRAPPAPPSIDIHIADFGISGGNGACWHRI
jgi:aspartyl/asparaginyl-tRNA synthetase